MNNKFTTYLLYAIGEIILVVVGILIAVSIDDWNEQKQAQALEKEYYCRFLESIEQDEQSIKNIIELHNDRIAASQKMLALLNNSQPDKKTVIDSWILGVASAGQFIPDKSGYEDLTSSGRINIIKNKKLINQLSKYLQAVEASTSSIEKNATYMINRLLLHSDPYEFGIINAEFVHSNSDSSLVQDLLNGISPVYTDMQRRKMIGEAIILNGTNNRATFHLENILNEVLNLKTVLQYSCQNSQK